MFEVDLFLPERDLDIYLIASENGSFSLHTRGFAAYGGAELSLRHVPKLYIRSAAELLNSIAAQIAGDEVAVANGDVLHVGSSGEKLRCETGISKGGGKAIHLVDWSNVKVL